jgi:holo-ACP synthase/triphosphoribosyl-dephospho-CoA synthase
MTLEDLLGTQTVTLDEILFSRERRAARQQEQLSRYPMPCISFTLNIAGPVKQFDLARRTFDEGMRRIAADLKDAGCPSPTAANASNKPVCEGYFSVGGDAVQIKRLMVELEQRFDLARLFDIDVLTEKGEHLSRVQLGYPPRRCLLCGLPAAACARSRAHAVPELQRRTVELMLDPSRERYADKVAQSAVRALLYELAVTPKPDWSTAPTAVRTRTWIFLPSSTAPAPSSPI